MYNSATNFDYEGYTTLRSCKVMSISDIYIPQTNGEISSSIMQNWTKQAVECYEIKSECSKCSLSAGNYSFVCQMPKIVNALLKTYGPPQSDCNEY